MKTIKVNASKNYNIQIAQNLSGLGEFALPLLTGGKTVIITDENVAPLYVSKVQSELQGKVDSVITLKAGEETKNAENYIFLVNELARLGCSRSSTIIALGGGVIGDLAGFVSATYMRGVNFIQIPTTLLAMVDSSVGGKTAIDLTAGKNLIGAFYQPSGVYVCLEFLKSLPEREIICGFGEIIKYAFIDGRITPSDIKEKNLSSLVEKALLIKRDIVEKDERESGERMLLNFGHTVGHAVEKLYNYTLSHGECVIKGMYVSIKVSRALNLISESDYEKMLSLLESTGVNGNLDFSKEEILSVMKKDKKASGESVNFVVTTGFGCAKTIKIEFSKLIELI